MINSETTEAMYLTDIFNEAVYCFRHHKYQ